MAVDPAGAKVSPHRTVTIPFEATLRRFTRRISGRGLVAGGATLRAMTIGLNDGIVSNTALVAGFAGAGQSPDVALLAGTAGLVSGAISMAAGEYISVRTQLEMLQHELAIEASQHETDPGAEEAELASIYRAKGLSASEAAFVARMIMSHPAAALDTHAREELGLDPGGLMSPYRTAAASFFAFALGAFTPLIPFLLPLSVTSAVFTAVVLAVAALLAAGALLTVFTAQPALRSSVRHAMLGVGAATATFAAGLLLGRILGI